MIDKAANSNSDNALEAGLDASLSNSLTTMIAAQIDSGSIPEGIIINETMLAQMFNVSRTPARKALENLAALGLISAAPKRGFITGQFPTSVNGRLTDFIENIDELTQTVETGPSTTEFFEVLEGEITRLSVLGSWRLSIRAAQDYYNMGRGVLEDLLREMEANGLLSRRLGGQWIVPKMDVVRLEHLFDVRSWIEPKMLEQATIHIPMEVLNSVLDAHEAALDRLNDITGPELDTLEGMLHHQLMKYAGNTPGLAALRAVNAGLILSKHILATEEIPLEEEDPFIEEHIAVLGALKRRRSEECKLRLLAHLLKSREKCTDRLERFRKFSINTKCHFGKRIDE